MVDCYNPSLVLVQPRKNRPYITERLLMGLKESNQTKTKNKIKLADKLIKGHPTWENIVDNLIMQTTP